MAKKGKQVIGRLDIINLPDLEIGDIHAEIDPCVYHLSLHCKKVYTQEEEVQQFVKTCNEETQKQFVIKAGRKIYLGPS